MSRRSLGFKPRKTPFLTGRACMVVQLPFALHSGLTQVNFGIMRRATRDTAVTRVALVGSPLLIWDGEPYRPVRRAGVNR